MRERITLPDSMCKVFGLPKLRKKAHFCAVSSTSGTATEVTAFSIITDYEKGIKYPIADFEITPDVAIVDPDLAETMMQRLSLAIALLPDPEVLILDEPTVGIDPVLRAEIWRELRGLAEGGVTILITTHVMDEAAKCTRLAMMREGHIIAEGTPESLVEQSGTKSIEEAFIYYGGGSHES